MKDEFEDIDKLFREAIAENHDAPSDKVWNNVEVSLDRKSVVELNKKYNNLKKLVAVLLLLLIVSISYEVYHLNQSHQSLKDSKEEIPATATAPKANSGNVSLNNNTTVPPATNTPPAHINNISSANDAAIVIKRARPKQSIFLKSSRSFRERIYKVGNTTAVVASDGINGTQSLSNSLNSASEQNKTSGESLSAIAGNTQGMSYSTSDFPIINPGMKPGTISHLAVNAKQITPTLLENRNTSKTATAVKLSKGRNLLQRLSINLFYSPDIDIFHHKHGDHRNAPEDFEKDEDRKYSYTTGVNINVSLNKHLSLRSGISYSSTSLHVGSRDIYAMQDNNGDTTFRFDGSCGSGNFHPPLQGGGQSPNIGDSLQVTDANNSLGYLRVPLALQYGLAKGRFIFDAFAGAAISFLVKGSLTATVANGTAKELQTVSSVDGLKKTTYTALMGLGAEYVLNRRINLTFSPLATLALTPINTSASAVQTYPNTLSFAAGVKIKL